MGPHIKGGPEWWEKEAQNSQPGLNRWSWVLGNASKEADSSGTSLDSRDQVAVRLCEAYPRIS